MNSNKKGRKRLSPALTIILDILLAAIVFGLFYGLLQLEKRSNMDPLQLPTPSAATSPSPEATNTPQPTQTPAFAPTDEPTIEPTIEPTEDPQYAGTFGAKFGHLFAAPGEVISNETTYKSHNVYITVERHEAFDAVYFVADIYVRELSFLKTAFSTEDWSNPGRVYANEIAENNNAILAISGDYAIQNAGGLTIRNGVLFREMTGAMDLAVLYYDGTIKTYSPDEFSMDEITGSGAYQAWCFGPRLLTDGKAMEKFNSNLFPKNPRSAIGYYEPGHYCFVMIDGRQEGYSSGMNLAEMSQLFEELGCAEAYNLDGGQSAMLIFNGEIVNSPYNGGRPIGDIIYISEP